MRPVIPLQGSSKDRTPKDKSCYNCGGPWKKGHVCRKTNINLIALDDESGVEDSDTDLAENDSYSQEDDSQSINMLESGENNEKTFGKYQVFKRSHGTIS